MKLRLKRIEPSSLALLLGAAYFLFGLFAGLFGLGASFSSGNVALHGPITFSGTDGTLRFLTLLYPLVTGFAGLVSGFILAWIYNFIARYTGGVCVHWVTAHPNMQREDTSET
ncbi:MAG: hypothetical protein ACQKBU_09525 [Verrucomicrobiales bacterium]